MYTNCWGKGEAEDGDVLGVLGANAKIILHLKKAG
jgi:hypothetical protein